MSCWEIYRDDWLEGTNRVHKITVMSEREQKSTARQKCAAISKLNEKFMILNEGNEHDVCRSGKRAVDLRSKGL